VPLLVLLFIVVPLAELYVILKVGEAIGPLWTVLILLADSIVGSLLLRSQGRAVWRRFTEAMNAGRLPHREVLDGALVIFGGAFLITPGFLTDVVGLFLLLPPTRAVARRFLVSAVGRRFLPVRMAGGAARRMRTRPGASQPDYDVEGTAVEHDDDQPRLER
jgi:UPF0716 protein FxsA